MSTAIPVMVKQVREAIANLPDTAQVVLWIRVDDDETTAVDIGRVTSYGPNGQEFHDAPDSLHLYEAETGEGERAA